MDYYIWMKQGHHEQWEKTRYSSRNGQKAQSLCNTLNAHKRKFYRDLVEQGLEFAPFPVDKNPNIVRKPKPVWGVYDGTGRILLTSSDFQEICRLAYSHDDYTYSEIKPLRK
jgi:hypothetical protein